VGNGSIYIQQLTKDEIIDSLNKAVTQM